MAVKKAYPRATVRKILRAQSGRNLSKNVDILVRMTRNLSYQDPKGGS